MPRKHVWTGEKTVLQVEYLSYKAKKKSCCCDFHRKNENKPSMNEEYTKTNLKLQSQCGWQLPVSVLLLANLQGLPLERNALSGPHPLHL